MMSTIDSSSDSRHLHMDSVQKFSFIAVRRECVGFNEYCPSCELCWWFIWNLPSHVWPEHSIARALSRKPPGPTRCIKCMPRETEEQGGASKREFLFVRRLIMIDFV